MSELSTLLRECFHNACKNSGLEHHEVTVELKVNSIYAGLTFSFKKEVTASTNKANSIVEEFKNILKEYVGNNIVVNFRINSNSQNDSHNLILQIDYDVIE